MIKTIGKKTCLLCKLSTIKTIFDQTELLCSRSHERNCSKQPPFEYFFCVFVRVCVIAHKSCIYDVHLLLQQTCAQLFTLVNAVSLLCTAFARKTSAKKYLFRILSRENAWISKLRIQILYEVSSSVECGFTICSRVLFKQKNAPFDMILKDSKALFGFSFQPWLSWCARDPGERIAGAPRHPRLETELRLQI